MTETIPAPLLASAPNFRDIGGYTNQGGKTVRRGRIFRSQLITHPTEADRAVLRRINIRYVCDLRGTHEREAAPNAWMEKPPPILRHLDIGMDVHAGSRQLLDIIVADPTANGIRTMMMLTYSLLPKAFEGRLGLLLDDLLAGDPFPALIHCTAGKDRTGFVTALIQFSLGMPVDVIHRDYALTEKYSNMERMMTTSAAYLKGIVGNRLEPDREMLQALCGTSPDYLDAAFSAIERNYGSIEAYLERTAGFDAAKRMRLRELMLE